MEEAELKDTASTYGKVLALRVFGEADKPKRGWVEYATRREAEYAVAELDQRWSHTDIRTTVVATITGESGSNFWTLVWQLAEANDELSIPFLRILVSLPAAF